MIKLYSVSTVAPVFRAHKDVDISWYITDRSEPVAPYEQLITGYHKLDESDREYSEGYIDELFTAKEAEQLKDYLQDVLGVDEVLIEEHKLPLGRDLHRISEESQRWVKDELGIYIPIEDPSGWMPYGAIPVGGSSDMLELDQMEEYDLPFGVWGYYDLEGYELDVEHTSSSYRLDEIESFVGNMRPAMSKLMEEEIVPAIQKHELEKVEDAQKEYEAFLEDRQDTLSGFALLFYLLESPLIQFSPEFEDHPRRLILLERYLLKARDKLGLKVVKEAPDEA